MCSSDLLESERQNAQLLSGTLTPQDESFSNSPGADTLGGLEMMAKESEILNDDALQGLIEGMRDVLAQCARMSLTPENFDENKCLDVLGDIDSQQVASWVAEGEGRRLTRRIKHHQLNLHSQALGKVVGQINRHTKGQTRGGIFVGQDGIA